MTSTSSVSQGAGREKKMDNCVATSGIKISHMEVVCVPVGPVLDGIGVDVNTNVSVLYKAQAAGQ